MRALFIKPKAPSGRRWLWLSLALLPLIVWAVLASDTAWLRSGPSLALSWPWTNTREDTAAVTAEQAPAPSASEAAAEASAVLAQAEASAPQSKEADPIEQQIQAFVNGWAASWSSKNLEAYFAAYSDKFLPENQKKLSDWALERKQKILAKSKISVQVSELTIMSADQHGLTVSFTQTYDADTIHIVSPKVLILSHQDDAWKIIREYTP